MGSECCFGPCGCIRSDGQGHGCLQCLCLSDQPICSKQVVLDCEPIGCAGGSEGVLRVQGCGEGCAAVYRAMSYFKLLMFGHGRVVHGRAVPNYSRLSSGMHCTVESHIGKSYRQK